MRQFLIVAIGEEAIGLSGFFASDGALLLAHQHLVLVVHEDAALFERAKLQILRCLLIQVKQLFELFRVQVHCVRVFVAGLELGLVLVRGRVRPVINVRLQLEDRLIVVEDRVAGKLHEFLPVDARLGVQVNLTFDQEDNLIGLFTIALDNGASRVLASEHPDDELVAEADLTTVKEVFESRDELVEQFVYQLSLHLGSQHLIQVELFNDQVKVRSERLFHRILNAPRQRVRHVIRLITALNTLHPEAHLIQLGGQKILEGRLGGENASHDRDQDGIVAETGEFVEQSDHVLSRGAS